MVEKAEKEGGKHPFKGPGPPTVAPIEGDLSVPPSPRESIALLTLMQRVDMLEQKITSQDSTAAGATPPRVEGEGGAGRPEEEWDDSMRALARSFRHSVGIVKDVLLRGTGERLTSKRRLEMGVLLEGAMKRFTDGVLARFG